ncbi:MAG: CehA/McbA family metallohydrolase [Bacteroidota bacterium]
MRAITLWLTLFVLASCNRGEKGNISYLGPLNPEELNIRQVISDYKADVLDSTLFTSNWHLPDGKAFSWRKGIYRIDTTRGNDQKIVIPGIGSMKTGDAMLIHMKMKNDRHQHLRYIGDTKGIKRIFLSGKEIFNYNGKLPAGQYDLLLVYIHTNQHPIGIPFTIASAVSGKLLPDIAFGPPEIKGTVALPSYENGVVDFIVTEGKSGANKPCRIYVTNERGEPQFDDRWPGCFETFTCDGNARLFLPAGKYSYVVESGKAYTNAEGVFEVTGSTNLEISAALKRFTNVNSEGWYAGDLHNHTSIEHTPLLMESENIHIGYVPWWWINPPMGRTSEKSLIEYPPLLELENNRYINTRVGEDERWDATLMFFGMPEDVEIPNATWAFPPSIHFAREYGSIENVWVHLDHMFWWQTPAILASGELNSIEVLNNNFVHGGVNDTEAWGKPRDMERYPPPYGNATYQQDLYFSILNCGLRIPPAAGSAACVGGGPFGYNRVYAHVEGELTYEKWWEALAEGKCFITNGPLLRVTANGELPGHVFRSDGKLSISTDLKIDAREKITEIQVIKNGEVAVSLPFNDWEKGQKIPDVKFEKSGWFLVRALTDNPGTYRTALTGPYFVEIGNIASTIHQQDVSFFLEWAREAAEQNIASDPEERAMFDRYAIESIRFWEQLHKSTIDQ